MMERYQICFRLSECDQPFFFLPQLLKGGYRKDQVIYSLHFSWNHQLRYSQMIALYKVKQKEDWTEKPQRWGTARFDYLALRGLLVKYFLQGATRNFKLKRLRRKHHSVLEKVIIFSRLELPFFLKKYFHRSIFSISSSNSIWSVNECRMFSWK